MLTQFALFRAQTSLHSCVPVLCDFSLTPQCFSSHLFLNNCVLCFWPSSIFHSPVFFLSFFFFGCVAAPLPHVSCIDLVALYPLPPSCLFCSRVRRPLSCPLWWWCVLACPSPKRVGNARWCYNVLTLSERVNSRLQLTILKKKKHHSAHEKRFLP